MLSPHKSKLWLQSTTTASYFSFHLMAIVCVVANLLLNAVILRYKPITSPLLTVTSP